MRQTSVDVYRQIVAEGLLTKKRLQVYEVLFHHGPLTGAQVSKKIQNSSVSETVRNRITELRDSGAVTELGVVPCPVTGRKVILWDVTSKLPVPPPKPEPMHRCPHCNGKGKVKARISEVTRAVHYERQPDLFGGNS